jgi:predicted transcriptional regulator YheO
MGDIIQFPRPHPSKKWSPVEILAIKEPHDTREQVRQERSRIATTKKIADEAGARQKKRAKRKQAIVDILNAGGTWTIALLMRLVGDRTGGQISRATVTEILKELETEGRVQNADQFWWKLPTHN